MVRIIKKITLLLLILNLVSCKEEVVTFKPERKKIIESIFASGYVKSKNQYDSYALVSGEIDEILVKEGDLVKAGQALIKLKNSIQDISEKNAALLAEYNDSKNNQGKIEEMNKMVELAKEKLSLDSSIYFRQKNLWQKNIGTKIDLEAKFLAYKNAKSAYSSAIQNLVDFKKLVNLNSLQAKNNLKISSEMEDNYIIRAKVDGQILAINREVGELVSPQLPLITIGNTSSYKLEMQIDENDIFDLKLGQKTYVKISSLPDTILIAYITKINPIMNERTKTFDVEAEFEKNPSKMFSNLSFEANIEIKSKENALVIPRNLLLEDSILLDKNENKIPVKIGLKNFEFAEVLSGLDESNELILPKK